jgi:formamidopyrimidine-DNA glycosylase
VPELPEVETVRRKLAPRVEGATLERLDVIDARWCEPAPPAEVADAVAGRIVQRISRRGKYLDWELDEEVHLVMHLRMTGNLMFEGDEPARFARARLQLGSGDRVVFADQRRFGTGIVLLGDEARDAYFSERLGVEPLGPDFTDDALREMARGRKRPVKAFLLDQERIAGVGNIYADEALYRARIHPLRNVGTLTRAQLRELRDGVVASLDAGLTAGGATISDYRQPDGSSGSSQERFLVHLREGEPCGRCGTTIKKMRAAGRGTYVCERCQPRPRPRRS